MTQSKEPSLSLKTSTNPKNSTPKTTPSLKNSNSHKMSSSLKRPCSPVIKSAKKTIKATARKKTNAKVSTSLSSDNSQSPAPIKFPESSNNMEKISDENIHCLIKQYREDDKFSIYHVSEKTRKSILNFVACLTVLERLSMVPFEQSEYGTPEDVFQAFDQGQSSFAENPQKNPQFVGTRDSFVTVLHRKYIATHTVRCSLGQFREVLSQNIERRPAAVRGYTQCLTCGNAEIKFDCLVNQGILDYQGDFEDLWTDEKKLELVYKSLDQIRNSKLSIPLQSWTKSSKGNHARALKFENQSVANIVKSLTNDLKLLEPHMKQVEGKNDVIRACLDRVNCYSNEVLVHVVWGETPKVHYRSPTNLISSDYCLSQLSGYVWTHKGEFEFCCLSDSREHGNAALWAHLEHPLSALVDQGFDRFYIVSDSNVTQFKVNNFYVNLFRKSVSQCFSLDACICLVF